MLVLKSLPYKDVSKIYPIILRSYRWLFAHCILKTLPYSEFFTFVMTAYVLLTSAKRQPLPIVVSLMLLPVTNFAQQMLKFSITVRCVLREVPLLYRLKDEPQRKVVRELWGSAYSFGYASILAIAMVFPMPCILWFHVAAANADLVAEGRLQVYRIINEHDGVKFND